MATTMLDRYYAPTLVLALLAPLWLGVGPNFGGHDGAALRDALVWSGVLIGVLLLTKIPRYQIRGHWRSPAKKEANIYIRLLLALLLIDFGSKALFFHWDRPAQVEVFKNFGFHSVFHVTPFESFHVGILFYSLYVFLLAPLYFRLSNKYLDKIWTISSAITLGGVIPLVTERFLFGGVHDSFYFAGPLMYLCPTCASPHFVSYAWTPADFFVHAGVLPLVVVVASYLTPARTEIRAPA
jgi:lipoprotein signal peptidase